MLSKYEEVDTQIFKELKNIHRAQSLFLALGALVRPGVNF